MPAIGFIYPDGEKITFEDVFDGNVDLERIGCSMPTLRLLAFQRDVERKPSTTELLSGTREAFLKRTEDYFIDPQNRAFALSGTLHHAKLENSTGDGEESERDLEHEGITGIPDLYDSDNHVLYDYKNFGSYKVAQVLGMDSYLVPHPEEERYKRNSKWGRKGEVKKVQNYYRNPDKVDFGDISWQLNWYRLMLEKSGKPVEDVFVQMTVRDGGTITAHRRGIDRNFYLERVPYIHEDHLYRRFLPKRDALLDALKTETLPDKCTKDERWGDNKCKKYCEVSHLCPYGKELS